MSKTKKQAPGWHKEDIKAAIRKKGETMVSLAEKNDMPTANVRNALARPFPSGEKVISDFLEVPLHTLWPDRWTKDGQRIRPRYAHKLTTSIHNESKCNGFGNANKTINAASPNASA